MSEPPDRISYLPKEIRDRILSNLLTEEAVRTSILSSQWRQVSSTLSHYHFDQFRSQLFYHYKLGGFILRTLNIQDIRSNINTLKIIAVFTDDALLPVVDMLISFALLCNFRELHLILHNRYIHFNNLPCSFFTSKTLQLLSLRNVELMLPRTVEFPSLKTLTLNRVTFTDDENETIRFFASCPVLEYLKMAYCELKHPHLTVESPELKVLDLYEVHVEGQISIASTVFNQLIYKGNLPPNIDLEDHPNLHCASFIVHGSAAPKNMPQDMGIQNAKIFAGPYHIVKLALLDTCVQCLARDPDLIYHLPASSPSVKHLQLKVCRSRNHVLAVTFLLRIFPNLETLSLLLEGSFESKRDEDVYYEVQHYRGSENLSANGILESLKIVRIKSLGGNDNELDLVRFLLENARNMERINIEDAFDKYWKSRKKYEVLKNKYPGAPYKRDKVDVEAFVQEEYETLRNSNVYKIQSFTRTSPLVVVSISPE